MGCCLGRHKEFKKEFPPQRESGEIKQNGVSKNLNLSNIYCDDDLCIFVELPVNDILWQEIMVLLRDYANQSNQELLPRGIDGPTVRNSEDGSSKPKMQRMKVECNHYSELIEFSGREVEEILVSCSGDSISPGSINSNGESVVTVILYCNERDINDLNDEEIEHSMSETLFFLAATEERFHKLKAYLNKIVKIERLLENASKLLDNNGNNVVNVALLQGNFKAFCFLVFVRCFEVTDYIMVDNVQKSFFIYLASKNWSCVKKLFTFLLKMYSEERNIQKLLFVDKNNNDNMVTFLIKKYALESNNKTKEDIMLYLENIFKRFPKIYREIMHIDSENLDVDLIICIGFFREMGKEILARILPHLQFSYETKQTYCNILKAFYKREPQMIKMFEDVFQ